MKTPDAGQMEDTNAAPQDGPIRKDGRGIVDADSRKVDSATSPFSTPVGAAPQPESAGRGELGAWYSPEEVSLPGVYICEGSETLAVMEIAPVRHYPVGGGKPFYKATKILDGSTARQDWGNARLFGPISLQALLKAAISHPAGAGDTLFGPTKQAQDGTLYREGAGSGTAAAGAGETPRTDALEAGIKVRASRRGFNMPEDYQDAMFIARQLERELNAGVRVPRWISVADELPNRHETVSVLNDGAERTAGFLGERHWHLHTAAKVNVTHWAPMPPVLSEREAG